MIEVCEHDEFVQGVQRGTHVAYLSGRVALGIVSRRPDLFGNEYRFMRGCGCLTFLAVLSIPWIWNWSGKAWFVMSVLAVFAACSSNAAVGDTARGDVMKQVMINRALYEVLVIHGQLTVERLSGFAPQKRAVETQPPPLSPLLQIAENAGRVDTQYWVAEPGKEGVLMTLEDIRERRQFSLLTAETLILAGDEWRNLDEHMKLLTAIRNEMR